MSDDNSIPKQVVKQLGQLSEETVAETVKAVGDVAKGVISGGELVGDVTEISPEKKQQLEQEDEQKLKQIRGRDVEGEMEEVRKEKKRQEEEEERRFLEEVRRKREQEQAEEAALVMPPGKKKQTGAVGRKPKKSDMSATAEFKAGVD